MNKSSTIIFTQLFFLFVILRCESNDEYPLNSQISSAQNQTKLKNNKCISCGAPGTFTRTKQLDQKCLCNPSQLVWNQEGFCDCGQGKAMTVQGKKITCSVCNSAINSQSKADSFSCNCLNPDLLVWNETLMRCQCPYPQIYIQGGCISCDEGIHSVGINSIKKGQCSCKNPLVWDKMTQQCKCLKGVIFDKDGEISCVNCGREVNSFSGSALTAKSCICPPQLDWIDNIGCVCQDMQLLISGKTPECISCSEDIFSKGISENGKECICINDLFKWSNRKKSCVCLKSSQVPVLNQKQQYVCYDCKNKKNLTTLPIIDGECTCVSNDVLIWNSKGYCECLSPQTDIYISFPNPHCISCDQTVYSNGKDIKRNICKCKDNNMIWNKQKSICSCKKSTQVLIFDSYEQPFCYQCENSSKLTRLPTVQGRCSCIDNNILVWFDEGFCGCPDQINQVYLTRPSPRCITCDYSINADGKNDQLPNTCNCVSNVLTFYNGICDCGRNSAFIIDSSDNFICINCLDSKRYLRSKNNSTTCNCLSDDMIWNHQTGSCDCPENKLFYSKSNVFKCIVCKGKNIVSTVDDNNQANCHCSDDKMSLLISQNNQSQCICPGKNSIVTLEGYCLTCLRDQRSEGVIFGAHQCKCYPGNYWDYKQNSCAPCSDIEYAKESINGNGFSCECEALYIWDVVSQKCIQRCKQGDSTCLNCEEISQTDRQSSSLKQLFPNNTRTRFNTIQAALQFYQVTNYFTLSKYQCGCIEGYIWDQYRFMCLLNTLM